MENLADMLIGRKTEHRQFEYTWRDMALYALAVGAKAKDLQYTYEKEMKALPTFGVLPYWGTIGITPRLPRPEPAALLADEYIHSTVAPLHMEHELRLYRSIDPVKGTLIFQDTITDVFDRGVGKGAVIRTRADVYDEAGNLICSNFSNTLFQEGGGFGGKAMPKSMIQIPDRNPDMILDDYISPIQNVLYRLTGDTNLVHVDPEFAQKRGFDRVFMQGLCSLGFACRMGIEVLIPGESERMTRISGQMRSILYMDTPIRLNVWKIDDRKAYFRLIETNHGAAVLDRGVIEWV